MNKARSRKKQTTAEAKHRERIGNGIEKAFRVFTGFYKSEP